MNQPIHTLPKPHQTMLLTHRAMVRDLDRIARTAADLARTADPVRSAALREYTAKLLDVIEHHHEGEDEILWPRLREAGADQESLALMTAEHEGLHALLDSTRAANAALAGGEGAAALADSAEKLGAALADHAADEEKELVGRLAPVLDERVWKDFAGGMVKSAPKWTLRFMPPWLASVAGPGEEAGVPAPPMARLFRGWLARRQKAAFGSHA